jgi:hypothetical protein
MQFRTTFIAMKNPGTGKGLGRGAGKGRFLIVVDGHIDERSRDVLHEGQNDRKILAGKREFAGNPPNHVWIAPQDLGLDLTGLFDEVIEGVARSAAPIF